MGQIAYQDEAGGAKVLWAVATADGAPTAKELSEDFDVTLGSLRNRLAKLYRSGLLVRRRREDTGLGGNPYEYALAPRAEVID